MMVIGVTGGSGSGKSFFCKKLKEAIGHENVCHLVQDHYYLPKQQQPLDENGISNFDTVASLDLKKYEKHVLDLYNGKQVAISEYVYNNPKLRAQNILLKPSKILLLEGLLVFNPPAVATLCGIKIFLEVDKDIRLNRRIKRDFEERGYDRADVLYRFENHAEPMYTYEIEPYKRQADFIFGNTSEIELIKNIGLVQEKINIQT
jgi:uridine kinase